MVPARRALTCTAATTRTPCPPGFCLVNDLAITAELLLRQGRVQRVLIFDLDVHQGDGTASIFAGRPDVFTLSVHAASNFPARKQVRGRG